MEISQSIWAQFQMANNIVGKQSIQVREQPVMQEVGFRPINSTICLVCKLSFSICNTIGSKRLLAPWKNSFLS
jgi:hypothetical protein